MKSLVALIILALIIWGVLRICGIRISFNILPSFIDREEVLLSKRWVWLGSAKSLPTYRWWPSLPPLVEHGLYVTDKRVLHVFHIFRLFKQEFSQWYVEKGGLKDNDFVKEVATGKSWLLGPYLEIVSRNSAKRWYRSSEARLRLFMRSPENICELIDKKIAENSKNNQQDRQAIYNYNSRRNDSSITSFKCLHKDRLK